MGTEEFPLWGSLKTLFVQRLQNIKNHWFLDYYSLRSLCRDHPYNKLNCTNCISSASRIPLSVFTIAAIQFTLISYQVNYKVQYSPAPVVMYLWFSRTYFITLCKSFETTDALCMAHPGSVCALLQGIQYIE